MNDMIRDHEISRSPVAVLSHVSLRYGKTLALDNIDLELPASRMLGLIGPDVIDRREIPELHGQPLRFNRGGLLR
jgi:ribosome-dependent ATPase